MLTDLVNPQPYTLNPTPSTLNPQPYTLNSKSSTLKQVRCTVLAEDLRQVLLLFFLITLEPGSHATESLTLSQGSTPLALLA